MSYFGKAEVGRGGEGEWQKKEEAAKEGERGALVGRGVEILC